MINWLAIETSSPHVSLAIGTKESCSCEKSSQNSASTSIESLFNGLSINLEEIDTCIIGQGPGSYNGLRVGYGFLKGLLCLKPKPVIQVPSPLIMTYAALPLLSSQKNGTILVINNARRGELYGAFYRVVNNQVRFLSQHVCPRQEILKITPPDLLATISYEFAADQLPEWNHAPVYHIYPTASMAAKVALIENIQPAANLTVIEPHYVRSAVPEVNKAITAGV